MIKTVLIFMGVVFILIGLVGFVSNNFLGTHLTPVHNVIHLVSGAASLYLGLKGTVEAARLFGFGFGAVYLLLGVVGYFLGASHKSTELPPAAQQGGVNEDMFRLIPGYLELGTMDHLVHVVFGLVFIIAAALTRGDATKYMEGNPG